MKPNTRTQTAAPKSERGTAPEIFKAVIQQLIEETEDNLHASSMPEEKELSEMRRLAILKIAAASNMRFFDFSNELYSIAPDAAHEFSDQLDTLSAIYDIALKNEQKTRAEK